MQRLCLRLPPHRKLGATIVAAALSTTRRTGSSQTPTPNKPSAEAIHGKTSSGSIDKSSSTSDCSNNIRNGATTQQSLTSATPGLARTTSTATPSAPTRSSEATAPATNNAEDNPHGSASPTTTTTSPAAADKATTSSMPTQAHAPREPEEQSETPTSAAACAARLPPALYPEFVLQAVKNRDFGRMQSQASELVQRTWKEEYSIPAACMLIFLLAWYWAAWMRRSVRRRCVATEALVAQEAACTVGVVRALVDRWEREMVKASTQMQGIIDKNSALTTDIDRMTTALRSCTIQPTVAMHSIIGSGAMSTAHGATNVTSSNASSFMVIRARGDGSMSGNTTAPTAASATAKEAHPPVAAANSAPKAPSRGTVEHTPISQGETAETLTTTSAARSSE